MHIVVPVAVAVQPRNTPPTQTNSVMRLDTSWDLGLEREKKAEAVGKGMYMTRGEKEEREQRLGEENLTFTIMGPERPGILVSPPSTACVKLMCALEWMSKPSRSKASLFATCACDRDQLRKPQKWLQ